MTTAIAILSAFLISCNGLSIGSNSERKTNRSGTSIGDAFPDWVPFKNKHGNQLGEFRPVTKSNVKKRLASPINYILRAVAESDDEYFDKDRGGDDNYENSDWTDTHRSSQAADKSTISSYANVSEIEGIVGILTTDSKKQPKNTIADAINNARKISTEMEADTDEETEKDDETSTTDEPKKKSKNDDTVDYEDSSEKRKTYPENDHSESEAKKAKILDAVDELKERHTEESRSISDKFKEEELHKQAFERSGLYPFEFNDKYKFVGTYKVVTPDYDEYEEKNTAIGEKYGVHPLRIVSSTLHPKRTTHKDKNKHIGNGQLSVFKTPQLYMVYDDDEETTTAKTKKYSARHRTIASINNNDERISLVPEDSKEGEPTLFYPVKRKGKKRKGTAPSYTTVANKLLLSADTTAADTRTDIILEVETTPTPTESDEVTDIAATGIGVTSRENLEYDTDQKDVNAVADAIPASSDHKKNADYRREKGGGREHDSEHEEEHEEHGKKAYEGRHEDKKAAKGHHDKENHLGKYDDHGGVDKHHSEETGHYGDHQHEENGKKHAKYEESGKHSKGHSTKGSHDVHKKEEYEKKVEFFEEEGDSAEEEKHGGFNHEKDNSQGGKFKKDNLKASHQNNSKGESGFYEKGRQANIQKGQRQSNGHDSHRNNGLQNKKKEASQGAKKWLYHHGFPARTANLVVIDRRGDQEFHVPNYFG